tara:strand:+ start:149 stop:1582 length:1434 start_codon:yes stop_codon:yes gene_type:complete
MSIPNGGLITETNRQYYAGAQQFIITSTAVGQTFTSTFNTDLVFGNSDPATGGYNLNNFKIFTSPNAQVWTELVPTSPIASTTATTTAAIINANAAVNVPITVANANVRVGMIIVDATTGISYGTVSTITDTSNFISNITTTIPASTLLRFQTASTFTMQGNVVTILTPLPGTVAAPSYLKIQMNETTAMWDNNGGYAYTRLTDVIDNFLIAYVGAGKLIPSVKRTDVIFHAKRGLQEFSYDTLKSIKSTELTVPNSLSLTIPQDYVNYVRLAFVDNSGVLRTIYPANTLTTDPYRNPVQDSLGNPTQNSGDANNEGTSQTEAAWAANNPRNLSGAFLGDNNNSDINWSSYYNGSLGQRYGLNPETSQRNGWFTIDERKGVFSFSNDLANKLIVIEYVSDGNAYDLDLRIPKMAEDALYAHISHGILASSAQTPEYIVRRYKQERSAKLRNAKIRLSNIKLDEIVQVMRGQSKWIKY